MEPVKREVTNIKKHYLSTLEGDTPEIKYVKRQRKESMVKSSEHQKQAVDQSTTITTNPVKRSSRFRGVSKHRWTGRYEAHLWDKSSWNVTQRKKGKQVYLGAHDEEESAARAYDLAALKYWGPTTCTNFPIAEYETELSIMPNLTKEEYLASLRRKSSGFSRGVSKYRGVARHHQNGRWEARIGRVFGNKYLYLGTYCTQEEAARAYDIAAIEYRGMNAVTNFDLSTYITWLRPEGNVILPSNDHHKMVKAQELPPSSDTLSHDEPELLLGTSLFPIEVPGSPLEQDTIESKSPVSRSCIRSSSSTALSLLLRSSIFKELVDKNSTASDEIKGDDKSCHSDIGSDDECGGIFYQRIADNPYLCSSNEPVLGIQLQEKPRSFYDQTRQFLLNVC